ncbi:MAG: ABC transporter substrate-binding protein [Acetobacteraceae bacterium]|nr:ABC transporter substrate-binding protein [Acetobacteraceae bacterium]
MSADRLTNFRPTRRHLMGLSTAVALAICSRAARADSDTDRATAFMTQMVAELIAVVNGSSDTSGKAVALQKIIDKDVDVNGIARFCLGRFWRQASPDEQKQYIELFHKVLLKNITGKVGDYSGVDISIQKTFTRDDGIVVSTSVLRPNNAPAKVDWLMTVESGHPLVIDVIAEGTSLRLTQRNDYSAFLTRNNNSVTALLDALKQQANG